MANWNLQLVRIYEKGARAFFAKQFDTQCPYQGRTGLNRQRADYWRQGYNAAKEGRVIIDSKGDIADAPPCRQTA